MSDSIDWRKSSYSNSGNCVEWQKSSYSFANGNCLEWRTSSYSNWTSNCVEVAPCAQVRDSKDPDGPVLTFTSRQWEAFVERLK